MLLYLRANNDTKSEKKLQHDFLEKFVIKNLTFARERHPARAVKTFTAAMVWSKSNIASFNVDFLERE